MSNEERDAAIVKLVGWGQVLIPAAVLLVAVLIEMDSELSVLPVAAFLLLGVPSIFAGFGLLMQRSWAWILSLVISSYIVWTLLPGFGNYLPTSVLSVWSVVLLVILFWKMRLWWGKKEPERA